MTLKNLMLVRNKSNLDIFNFLYRDATVYLEHKKEKFDFVFCRP